MTDIRSIDGKFLQDYCELLINRVTHRRMKITDEADKDFKSDRYRNNWLAFRMLMDEFSGELTENLVIKVADQVNASSMYISNGYRKFGNFIADTEIPMVPAEKISEAVNELIFRYNTEYQKLGVYEKEARFHIEFIRIHPFEDGNGRTGQLLLNYNLMRQNVAPVVMTEEMCDYYHECIKNSDVYGLAKLFAECSKKEKGKIYELYGNRGKKFKRR